MSDATGEPAVSDATGATPVRCMACDARDTVEVDRVVSGAARHVLGQHRLLRLCRPSALDTLLPGVAGPATMEQGRLRPWLELLARSYTACQRREGASWELELVAAVFATAVWSLEVLDDLADGDEPDGGRQAPNLALALLGEGTGLLARLPAVSAGRLVSLWGTMWMLCAAAQARDVALAPCPDLTVEEALTVAEGSGLVTRWAVEAGAIVAGAPPGLVAPLAAFGAHLGTAEKLLHDLRDLWPGPHPSRDLRRPCCSLALTIARGEKGLRAAASDDALRHRLLESGALHLAWAHADAYRLRAAAALDHAARQGGNPAPLTAVLALPPDLQAI